MKGCVLRHIFFRRQHWPFLETRKTKVTFWNIFWRHAGKSFAFRYAVCTPSLPFFLAVESTKRFVCVWNLSSGRMEVCALCRSLVGGRNEFWWLQTCIFSILRYLLTFWLWDWWKVINEINTRSCERSRSWLSTGVSSLCSRFCSCLFSSGGWKEA